MKKSSTFLLLFTIITYLAFGQSISLKPLNPNNVCQGGTVKVTFSVFSGNFAAGNSYKLQIGTILGGNYQDIGNTSAIDTITANIPNTYVAGYYYLRIMATNPVVYSNAIELAINTTPKVDVISSFPNILLNPYDPVQIGFRFMGGGPWQVTISDSTKTTINSYSSLEYSTYNTYYPARTQDYSASATNACGTARSNSLRVNVKEKGFRIIGSYPIHLCAGTRFYLNYSVDGELDTNPEFSLEFINTSQQNSSTTITATPYNKGVLSVDIPKNLTTGYYNFLLTEKKSNLKASYGNVIYIKPQPIARLFGSYNIDAGNIANIESEASGGGFVAFNLNDDTYWGGNVYESGNKYLIKVFPTESTVYTIKSAISDCGEVAISGSSTVQVSNTLYIDSLSKNMLCPKESFNIYIHPNSKIDPKAQYAISFVIPNQSNIQEYIKIDATWIGNNTLTASLPADFKLKNLSTAVYSPRLHTNGVAGFANNNINVVLNSLPEVNLLSYPIIEKPSRISVPVAGNIGVGAYEIELTDGTLVEGYAYLPNYTQFIPIFPTATTNTYAIRRVKNVCGVGVATGTANINVKEVKTEQIFVQPISFFCHKDSIRISFYTSGSFGNNNTYTLELSDANGYFSSPTIYKTNTSSFTIPIPSKTGSYKYRVVSTVPSLKSNEESLTVNASKITLRGDYYNAGEVFYGENLQILKNTPVYYGVNYSSLGSITYTLTDGSSNTNLSNGYASFYTYPIKSDTQIGFKTAKDACGREIKERNAINIKVIETAIVAKQSITGNLCLGIPFHLPFRVYGTIPINATYTAQLSRNGKNFFDIPSSYEKGVLVVTPPDTLNTNVNYFIRVSAKTPNGIIEGRTSYDNSSTYMSMKFQAKIRGKLTINNSMEQITIDGGQLVTLKINANTNDNARIILSDDRVYNNISSTNDILVSPTKSTQYEVKSVSGTCGYGTVTGKVNVVVKPSITEFYTTGIAACSGSIQTFFFKALGDFENSNTFKFYIRSYNNNILGDRIEIGQTIKTTSTILLNIPQNLPAATYQFEVESSAPILKRTTFFYVATKPTGKISGTTTAYPNQPVNLKTELSGGSPYTFNLNERQLNEVYVSQTFTFPAPNETTTYKMNNLRNACGTGTASGEAIVNIIKSDKQILPNLISSVCAGARITLYYTTNTTFESNNVFTVQLSDSTGKNFIDIPTIGNTSPLQVTIPTIIPKGYGYRLRIKSTSPALEGAASTIPFTISSPVIATLSTPTPLIMKGDTAQLKIDFTGTPPWSYTLSSILGNAQGIASSSPVIIKIIPDSTIAYKLNSVASSSCGQGVAQGAVTITVTRITSIDIDELKGIKVFPNPVSTDLYIDINQPDCNVRIINSAGTLIKEQRIRNKQEPIGMTTLPMGTYIIEIVKEDKKAIYKVQKY